MNVRGLAFLDLDHTLLDGDSDSSFLDLLGREGVVGEDVLAAKEPINAAYMEGRPWQTEYRALLRRIYAGLEVAPLEALARAHAEEHALPMLFEGARGLIARERARRDGLFLLTTTNQLVAEPIAALLELDGVLSTRLRTEAGRFTGEVGAFCTGPGKREALEARCAELGVAPADCAMYGDGRSDMDALAAVGEPHAVHPNDELDRVAAERGWPVLDLSGVR